MKREQAAAICVLVVIVAVLAIGIYYTYQQPVHQNSASSVVTITITTTTSTTSGTDYFALSCSQLQANVNNIMNSNLITWGVAWAPGQLAQLEISIMQLKGCAT